MNWFVHIPKNGGNTFVTYSKGFKRIGHNLRNERYLMPYKVINKDDRVVAFIRNPIKRVVSAYNYLIKKTEGPDKEDADKFVRPYMDINDFIKRGLQRASEILIHFKPQLFWVKDEQGMLLNIEYYPLEELDNFLKKEFGVKDIQKINKGPNPENNLTEESIDKIKDLYYDDLKFWSILNGKKE